MLRLARCSLLPCLPKAREFGKNKPSVVANHTAPPRFSLFVKDATNGEQFRQLTILAGSVGWVGSVPGMLERCELLVLRIGRVELERFVGQKNPYAALAAG